MKPRYALLAAVFLPTLLLAQSPLNQAVRMVRSGPERLPNNYAVTLKSTDGDSQPLEVTVVTSSTQFEAKPGEQLIQFSGSLAPEESGEVYIAYDLGWDLVTAAGKDNQQIRHSSAQGSVRLKPGEEIQIYKAGAHTVALGLRKVEATPAK